MSGRKHKAKGDGYERELASYLSDALGLHVERAPLSGGGFVSNLTGGADLLGLPALWVEAKRTERPALPAALKQAETGILKSKSPDRPVVISRQNRMKTGESYVALRLSDFCDFYSSWLRENGHVARP